MSGYGFDPRAAGAGDPDDRDSSPGPVGAGRGWRPWMVQDSDGPGLFELEPPRTEDVDTYADRVGSLAHDEALTAAMRRRNVPERVAVEDIDAATTAVANAESSWQAAPDGHDDLFRGSACVELTRDRLQAAKEAGRRVLGSWSGWSGDREVDRLSAHARQVLAAAVRDQSDAVAELERHEAVEKWTADDVVALADADGVLDGWQW